MKNNLSHRSLKILLGFVIYSVFSTTTYGQTVTGDVFTKIFHNTSSTSNSVTTYFINLSNGWQPGISSITSLTLKNVATNTVVYTHSGSTINYGTVTSSLAPGQYLFTGTVSTKNSANKVVSVSLSQNIWVGNKVLWENCFDMEQGVSQYSMKRSVATAGQTYSYTQSFNSLAANTLGWVEMSKLNSNINDSRVYWVLETMANPRSFTPTDNISHVEFYRDNTGASKIKVRYKQTNGVYRDSIILGIAATDKIRFQRNANNTAILQVGNLTPTKFSFPSTITGALKVTILAKQLNDQADEIATSFTYPSSTFPISTTYSTTDKINTGTITAQIAPLSGFSSPYNYFITPGPVADMKSVYKYLKDSIYPGGVDSTTFFRGATGTTSFTSTQLSPGSYYASAFDSKGVRIYANKYEMTPIYSFDSKNLFENSYNEFLSTSPNSYISANTYVSEESNAKLVYTLTNTTVEQSFGMLLTTDPILNPTTGSATFANLKFGFTVIGGQLFSVVNGVKSVTSISAKANVPLELVIENGVVSIRSEGTELTNGTIPTNSNYKSGAYIKGWGVLLNFTPINIGFRPYSIKALVNDNACGKNTGDLQLTFAGLHGAALTNVNFTLKNITDDANPITVYSNITTGVTYNDLPLGVYSLEGGLTVGGISYTGIKRVIYVGSKLSWDPYVNIVTWPSGLTNSVIASTSVSTTNAAKAISTNRLDPQTDGWAVATPAIPPLTPSNTIFNRTSFSLSQGPLLLSPSTFDPSMPVVHFVGGMAFTCTSAATQSNGSVLFSPLPNYNSNIPILVVRSTTGGVKFRQNYTALRSVANYAFTRWKPDVYTNIANAGMKEMVGSFQCKSYSTDMFAELKYDLDGYYHVMKEGKVRFVFNQEYDTQNQLKFNIYNEFDRLIKTQNNYPNIQVTNGENYLTIDVTGTTTCIGTGMFYLEVINDKKEKFYLRFYNEYTGCIPQLEGEGQGL